MLGPGDRGIFYRLLRDGCPVEPRKLQLRYRASRDGFSTACFHSKCDDVGPTITLVRVGGFSPAADDCIVGGFSDVSWSGELTYKDSAVAFIFMLRDSSGHETASHEHATRWGINEGVWHTDSRARAVFCSRNLGPKFGEGELEARFYNGKYGAGRAVIYCHATVDGIYNKVPKKSLVAYNDLNGKNVVDVEVFTVDKWGGAKPTQHQETSYATPGHITAKSSCGDDDGIESCEVSTFECMSHERESLQRAKADLEQTNARLDEAVQTMTELYGPGVPGETDAVLDLAIRGTPMSTLWSTLQVCPDSALAIMFSERWQKGKKGVDAQGRRHLDCDPACFAKVLEVLRSKKRVSLADAHGDRGREGAITTAAGTMNKGTPRAKVVVDAAKRECFDELVNKYLPGYEDFIMESVTFSS